MSTINICGVQVGCGDSALIEDREKARADTARVSRRMPTPSGPLWNAIKYHYGLPDPKHIDCVLSEVTLPDGWKMEADPDDPCRRKTVIIDREGRTVGYVFLKDTFYDRYGSTNFCKKRLQELGIKYN